MILKNEDYALTIDVRYKRINTTTEKTERWMCSGTGSGIKNDCLSSECSICDGLGYKYELVEIADPPNISKKFLEDLKEYVRNYQDA